MQQNRTTLVNPLKAHPVRIAIAYSLLLLTVASAEPAANPSNFDRELERDPENAGRSRYDSREAREQREVRDHLKQRATDQSNATKRTLALFPSTPPLLNSELATSNSGNPTSLPFSTSELNRPVFNSTELQAQLIPYATTSLYTPLSIALSQNSLSSSLQKRLTRYRDTSAALCADIRAALAPSTGAHPPEFLSSLALRQADSLAALEAETEALRLTLISCDERETTSDSYQFFGHSMSPEAEANFLNHFAAYQDGLSIDQRQLLHKTAHQILASQHAPLDTLSLDPTQGDPLYFLPASSRLSLPVELPDSLRIKIKTFNQNSAAILDKLQNTIRDQERTTFGIKRTKAFQALALEQAPRFAALETLAEEIRHDLAPLIPNFASSPILAPSPELSQRATRYIFDQQLFRQELSEKLRATKQAFPEVTLVFDPAASAPLITLKADATFTKKSAYTKISSDLQSFNVALSARHQALQQERASILQQVRAFAKDPPSINTGDQVVTQFASAIKRQETLLRYRDYYHTALTPGLSPAQRRLLFSEAVAQLQ